MDNRVFNECYCRSCGREHTTEHREYECPSCGSEDVHNTSFLTCNCGERVYLGSFTNECCGCGRLYNPFGQELAPVREWDDDDRYECFGPQNDEYYD